MLISTELKNLSEIQFRDKAFKVEYFFCSDWKFTAICLGLNAASSNHPCLWCTAHKDQFSELRKGFSIIDKAFSARNAEDQSRYVMSRSNLNLGYKCISLLNEFIDFKYCIIDTLHLFFRITDRLNELFVKAICDIDSIEINSKIDFTKHKCLEKYFMVLKQKCKIKVEPYVMVINGQ